MNTLTISDALKLYNTLQPYLPEVINEDKPIEFIGTIVSNIKNSGNHRIYVEAIALMMNTTVESIIGEYSPSEALELFIEGLSINHIILLKQFGEQLRL